MSTLKFQIVNKRLQDIESEDDSFETTVHTLTLIASAIHSIFDVDCYFISGEVRQFLHYYTLITFIFRIHICA